PSDLKYKPGAALNLASTRIATADRQRWATLMVVCLAQLMIVLDTTIVNVALPSIQHDLHFSQANLTWVVNAFLVTFGSLLLLAGGLLTEALSWHWIFFVNVPIGIATFALGMLVIPADSGRGLRHGVDWLGSALVTFSLMSVIYAIVEVTANGWGSSRVLGFGALALALMAAFVAGEDRKSTR